jgi:hypothetical protein
MLRRATLILLTWIISVSTLFAVFPQAAHADGTPAVYLAPTVVDAANKSSARNSIALCLAHNGGQALPSIDVQVIANGTPAPSMIYTKGDTAQNIANYNWFDSGASVYVALWSFPLKDLGRMGCGDSNLNTKGMLQSLFGSTNIIKVACTLGFKRADTHQDCQNGTGDFAWGGGNKQDVLNRIDTLYAGTPFGKDYTPEQYYVMAMTELQNAKACKATPIAVVNKSDPNNNLNEAKSNAIISVVDSTGAVTQTYYAFGGDQGTTWPFRNGLGNDESYDNYGKNCSGLAQIANENAAAYAKWVSQNPAGSQSNPGTCEQYAVVQAGTSDTKDPTYTALLNACNAGQTNKSDANYCDKNYPLQVQDSPTGPHNVSTPEHDACVYGRDKASDGTSAGSTDPTGNDNNKTCGIQGIGWLVCPVLTAMANVTDLAYNFLASNFLSFDKSLLGDTTQAAWAQFRDIANVAFVFAFLFIVYSQVTSMGIGNYGIKKMLPRLAIAAILVNLSFFICEIAVDLSNFLGYAIPHLFNNLPSTWAAPVSDNSTGAQIMMTTGKALTWVGVIGGLIAVTIGLFLAVSIPVLLAALLAIGLIVLMLMARQALIVLLIVISPLAFVAYLFPNTEQWFKKWSKMLFTLLMLFPIIGTVFGGSRLAALIIANSNTQPITQIVALGVSAIPFFVVPGLLKGSLAAAGAIGAKLQGLSNKATGKIGARVKDSSYAGAYMAQRKKLAATKRAQGYGATKGLKGATYGRLSRSRLSGSAGSQLATTGSALASKEEREAVDNEVVAMQKQSGWTEANKLQNAQSEFERAMKSGNATKARAAQQILLGGGNKGIGRLQDAYSNLGSSMSTSQYESMMNDAPAQKVLSDLSGAGIKGKNAALTQMSYTPPVTTDANGKKVKNTVDSIANSADTYNALTDTELAGQSEENLERAISSRALSPERAQRLQTNDTVWSQLSEGKKQMIAAAAGPAPSAPAPPSSGAAAGQASSPTQLTIAHGSTASQSQLGRVS